MKTETDLLFIVPPSSSAVHPNLSLSPFFPRQRSARKWAERSFHEKHLALRGQRRDCHGHVPHLHHHPADAAQLGWQLSIPGTLGRDAALLRGLGRCQRGADASDVAQSFIQRAALSRWWDSELGNIYYCFFNAFFIWVYEANSRVSKFDTHIRIHVWEHITSLS